MSKVLVQNASKKEGHPVGTTPESSLLKAAIQSPEDTENLIVNEKTPEKDIEQVLKGFGWSPGRL